MRKRKINKFIQAYSEIPIVGCENDLNRIKEVEALSEEERNTNKKFGSFIKNRYVLGAVVCAILIAIILPISLVFSKERTNVPSTNNGEQTSDYPNKSEEEIPELLFCGTDQINLSVLDSIDAFNILYGYHIETLHLETMLSTFYEIRLKENDLLIGLQKEECVWNEKIDSVDTIAYVTNYVINDSRFAYFPYEIEIDGIMYKYNFVHEVDYEYFVEYNVDNVRYQSKIVCYDAMEIEDLINSLFA